MSKTTTHPIAQIVTLDGALAALVKRLQDPKLAAKMRIQDVALKAIHDFMEQEGVTQLLPVILSPVTDPLNHSVHDAHISYHGQDLQLTKSMILHKQAALIADIDRMYIMSPNVRLEKAECGASGRHLLEFTQVDMEFRGASKDEFLAFAERLVTHILERVIDRCSAELNALGRALKVPVAPFARHESKKLEAKHGAAWESIASAEATEPFWVFDLKREFYDREDAARPGYYHNYDLVWPEGFGEALSGAERDHEYDVLLRKIHERGQDPAAFGPYMELARAGLLVPSAGGGLGVERLVRYLTGSRHIADATLLPRVPGVPVVL